MNRVNHPEPDRTRGLIMAGLNLIQQAISIYDQDLKLAVCNTRFQELFDLPEHLVKPGARFDETIRYLTERGEYGPVDDVEDFVVARVKLAREFEQHYLERTRADGTTISVEGSPLQQGGWVTVYTDISDTKHQEELLFSKSEVLNAKLLDRSKALTSSNRELASTIKTLEQTRRDLIDSEARARLSNEMIPAHVAHLDMNRRYTYSNRRLSGILPGSPEEIIGMNVKDVLGANFAKVEDLLDAAYSGTSNTFEFTAVDTNSRIRVSFTPDIDDQGRRNGVHVMSMNITAEAQARASLAQTHRRELAAQLTSGLAHDFGNLLTIILGVQSRLAGRDDLPEKAMESVATTRAAALRGGAILEKLANISGSRETTETAVRLDTLLGSIKVLAEPLLPDHIALTIAVDEAEGLYALDTGSLTDSLINLILNARDAMQNDAGIISVTATAKGNQWISLDVRDQGPGFSDEALERGIEPFYTTKNKRDGTGLGLPMVFDFAQISGGQLTVANATESGGIVTLLLPQKRATQTARKLLVLLVEDDPDIRETTRDVLRDMGHQVIEASSVAEARQLAQVPEINLILSDLYLGEPETGLALAQEPNLPPVLFLTSAPPKDPVRKQATRLRPILQKPFTPEALESFLIEHTK